MYRQELHLLFAREKNRHNATRLLFQNVPSFLYHFSPRPFFFSKFIRCSFLNQSKLFQKTRKLILVLILKKRKTSFSRTTEKLYASFLTLPRCCFLADYIFVNFNTKSRDFYSIIGFSLVPIFQTVQKFVHRQEQKGNSSTCFLFFDN